MLAELMQLEELQAPAVLGYIEDALARLHRRNNYLGPTVLPGRRVEDLSFEYLVGAGHVPVAAHIVEFDSPSPTGRRVARLDKVTGELLTSKVKLPKKPKDLLRIRRALQSRAPDELKQVIRNIFDDTETVLASLAARVEWMRWQVLSSGKLLYNGNGVVVELDYQLPPANEVYVTIGWDDPDNATPLTDIKNLCDAIADTYGVRPARAVCRTSTWNEILAAAETKNWVHGVMVTTGGSTLATSRPVTSQELRQLMAALELPAFTTYDVKVQVEDPVTGTLTETHLIPDNTIILLPPSNVELGQTLFGPTPSEVMNLEGFGDALRQMEEAPRYVVRLYEEGHDPATIWTLGEVTAVPAVPGIKYCGILHTRPQS